MYTTASQADVNGGRKEVSDCAACGVRGHDTARQSGKLGKSRAQNARTGPGKTVRSFVSGF